MDPGDSVSDSIASDSLVESDGSRVGSGYDLFDLLAVLAVAVALVLVLGYVMYGL